MQNSFHLKKVAVDVFLFNMFKFLYISFCLHLSLELTSPAVKPGNKEQNGQSTERWGRKDEGWNGQFKLILGTPE